MRADQCADTLVVEQATDKCDCHRFGWLRKWHERFSIDARAGDQKNSVLFHSEPFHDSAIIAVLNEHGVSWAIHEDANERPDYRGG